MTASTAYTLISSAPLAKSGRTRGTTTSEYEPELRGMVAHAAIWRAFAQNGADSGPRPSFQLSYMTKEVNRMLKFFIAGQTYAMGKLDAFRNNEEGQTMAEYGVVLAVITMGVVIALTALGTEITGALGRVTNKLKP